VLILSLLTIYKSANYKLFLRIFPLVLNREFTFNEENRIENKIKNLNQSEQNENHFGIEDNNAVTVFLFDLFLQ